jgi:hypothetical protein
MALARCEKCGRPSGNSSPYVCFHEPVAYPHSPVVCGARSCERPARVWLTTEEQQMYVAGRRIFTFAMKSAKVRLQ